MSGDTISSELTWVRAACSVDASSRIATSRAQANRGGGGTDVISKHSSRGWFVRAARVAGVGAMRVGAMRVGAARVGAAQLQMAGGATWWGGLLVDRLHAVNTEAINTEAISADAVSSVAVSPVATSSADVHPIEGQLQTATLRDAASRSARHSTVEQRRHRELEQAVRSGEHCSATSRARGGSTPR